MIQTLSQPTNTMTVAYVKPTWIKEAISSLSNIELYPTQKEVYDGYAESEVEVLGGRACVYVDYHILSNEITIEKIELQLFTTGDLYKLSDKEIKDTSININNVNL